MKKAASIIVSLVLLLAFALSLSACTDIFSTVDYPSISNLEQAISMNGTTTGKTVKVTVEKIIPDAPQGFIVQQGNFNFCLASDPGVAVGDTVTFKISNVARHTDAFYVTCTKV